MECVRCPTAGANLAGALPPSSLGPRRALRRLPKGDSPVLLALWSPKGGSGTSVVAAAAALVSAGRGETRLADLGGDQPAILGLRLQPSFSGPAEGRAGLLAAGPSTPTEWLDDMAVPVVPGLTLLPLGPEVGAGVSPEAGAALAVALRDGGVAVLDAGSG